MAVVQMSCAVKRFSCSVPLQQGSPRRVLCWPQPGTHCKWANLCEGCIADFTTAMAGEMFALLQKHSILAAQLTHLVEANSAFLEGVEDAARGTLLTDLFQVRAATLMGVRPEVDAASYCSGLLIGTDVTAQMASSDHTSVYLLADPPLSLLYSAAIKARGALPTLSIVTPHLLQASLNWEAAFYDPPCCL